MFFELRRNRLWPSRVTRRGDAPAGRRRVAAWVGGLLAALALVAVLGYPTLLGAVGRFLVVEDPLEAGGAIVVLGGATPYREIVGAEVYRAGWAPRVVLVRAGRNRAELELMEQIGVTPPDALELRRQVLRKLGVPAEAIVVAPGEADATLDELELAARMLPDDGSPTILVTSNYHARRVSLYWQHLFGRRHKGIVRVTPDRFDPDGWWRQQATILNVVRELLGLANYTVGFPVAQRAPS